MLYSCPFSCFGREECPFANAFGECDDYMLKPLHEDAWCRRMISKGIDKEFEEEFSGKPKEIMDNEMKLATQAWKGFKREGKEKELVKFA